MGKNLQGSLFHQVTVLGFFPRTVTWWNKPPFKNITCVLRILTIFVNVVLMVSNVLLISISSSFIHRFYRTIPGTQKTTSRTISFMFYSILNSLITSKYLPKVSLSFLFTLRFTTTMKSGLFSSLLAHDYKTRFFTLFEIREVLKSPNRGIYYGRSLLSVA